MTTPPACIRGGGGGGGGDMYVAAGQAVGLALSYKEAARGCGQDSGAGPRNCDSYPKWGRGEKEMAAQDLSCLLSGLCAQVHGASHVGVQISLVSVANISGENSFLCDHTHLQQLFSCRVPLKMHQYIIVVEMINVKLAFSCDENVRVEV